MRDRLFDSSSVMNSIRNNRLDKLLGGYTLTLASYEVGNALWREIRLRRTVSSREGTEVLQAISETLKKMTLLGISGEETEILELAERENLTYCDASYLYIAAENGFTLVTDDRTFLEKARKHTKAIKSAQT